MEERIQKLNSQIAYCIKSKGQYERFLGWFLQNNTETKKVIVEKFLKECESFGATAHTIKNTKKGDLGPVILRVCNKRISELNDMHIKLSSELNELLAKKEAIRVRNERAAIMHKLLDDKLKNPSNSMDTRQEECLRYLIDCGDVATEEALSKYIYEW